MSEAYQIIEKKETQRLAAFVAEHGQAFFPLVSLVEQSQLAVEFGPGRDHQGNRETNIAASDRTSPLSKM